MTTKILSILCCFTIGVVLAQKRPITHDDYDLWKNVDNIEISAKGKLVVSTISTTTGRGDGYLQIYNTETKQKNIFFNGIASKISYDENFVIFKKTAGYQSKRIEKKNRKKERNKR